MECIIQLITTIERPKRLHALSCSVARARNTGACDGEIRLWDLSRRSCVWRAVGHRGFVRGLAVTPDGESFLSAGDDGMVKQWDLGVASDLTQVTVCTASQREMARCLPCVEACCVALLLAFWSRVMGVMGGILLVAR